MRSMLFTYGTLMPLDPETAARDGYEPDAVRGFLYDLGPFPALVELDHPEAGWVEGYVVAGLAPESILRLDAYEGTDEGPYRRVEATTRNNRLVWVYVYDQPLPPDARGPLDRWDGSVRVRLSSFLAPRQGDS
jgi:gamma-glutamylcyclotransferase (GGCT)/AIG2-like uncharacterized protein YtfP